jgi:holdfast attachment protein HfaA
MSRKTLLPGLIALCLAGSGGPGFAQSLAVTPAWVTGGYNGAAAAVSQSFDPSTRDAYGNRLVLNGEIVTAGVSSVADRFGAIAAGCEIFWAGANTSATAIGNLSQIQIDGSWNTVVASIQQTNSGPVTATATVTSK